MEVPDPRQVYTYYAYSGAKYCTPETKFTALHLSITLHYCKTGQNLGNMGVVSG